MDEAREKLQAHNIAVTAQRTLILRYLQNERTHPTAEDIYKRVVCETPSISKATVYNTLETLVEASLVVELRFLKERAHYDIAGKPHFHFFCRKCKSVYDINCAHGDDCHFTRTERIDGHLVDEAFGVFYGICKSCLKS